MHTRRESSAPNPSARRSIGVLTYCVCPSKPAAAVIPASASSIIGVISSVGSSPQLGPPDTHARCVGVRIQTSSAGHPCSIAPRTSYACRCSCHWAARSATNAASDPGRFSVSASHSSHG
jgi:hypothetical protein